MSKYGFRLLIRFSGTPLNLFPRQLSRPCPDSRKEHRSRNSFLRPNSSSEPSATSGTLRGKYYWPETRTGLFQTSSNFVLPSPSVYSESRPTSSGLGWPRPPYCRGCCKTGACAAGNAPKSKAGCRDKPRTRLGRQRLGPPNQEPQGPSAGRRQEETRARPRPRPPSPFQGSGSGARREL